MSMTGKTFRIFVSSTFSDLKEERNALQERVFPRLRELCRQNGCRFQAVDLRWGVREEAGLDQQTMAICLGEIERCQRTTPRPNFIVLLGDRYGWRPLPAAIPVDEYRRIEPVVADPEDSALLRRWYVRDDNAIPPVYCLQPRQIQVPEGAADAERRQAAEAESREWIRVEARLRGILTAAVSGLGFSDAQQLKFQASATEQEIEAGALRVADAEKHVFCFLRRIDGVPADASAGIYTDLDAGGAVDAEAQRRLTVLKARLRVRLPGNVRDYEARWRPSGITTDHIDGLCADVWHALSEVIRAEIAQLRAVDSLEQESADHTAFARARSEVFIGRSGDLQRIAEYLAAEDPSPLAVFGASGLGKSALLARALEQTRTSHPDTVIVARFIGATPASGDIRALLESLCRQITRACGGDEMGIPSEYKELAEEFPKRLALATAARPVVLFIDALDQLGASHNARGLHWLPGVLPDHVRLVVSVAPSVTWEALKRKIAPPFQEELLPLSAPEGGRILDAWLHEAGRTLQAAQRDEVLGKFAGTGLPLWLKFAFEEARHWKSYAPAVELAPDGAGIIGQLLERLSAEANHGPILVARALAYLRAASHGLSEDEIIDLLSLDDAVFGDFQRRAFFQPPEPRLPVVVWSRFFFDLEPYLNSRNADGTTLLGFFHRQMGEVVDATYLAGPDKAAIHARLAAYFAGQPLFTEADGARSANLRKLSELPFQQTEAGLWDDLYATLTDFEFLEAKCTHSGVIHSSEGEAGSKLYGGVYELLEDYHLALERFPK
jgi:hypothetical protein